MTTLRIRCGDSRTFCSMPLLRNNFLLFAERCFLTLNPGAAFLRTGIIKAIGFQLERMRRGDINRLIINLPPRHLKSLMVSVAFPAFVLGHEPCASDHRHQLRLTSCLQACEGFPSDRRVGWYRRVFPKMRIRTCHRGRGDHHPEGVSAKRRP